VPPKLRELGGDAPRGKHRGFPARVYNQTTYGEGIRDQAYARTTMRSLRQTDPFTITQSDDAWVGDMSNKALKFPDNVRLRRVQEKNFAGQLENTPLAQLRFSRGLEFKMKCDVGSSLVGVVVGPLGQRRTEAM